MTMMKMKRLLRQIRSNQRGQALPAVLALLVVGSVTIVPGINHVATTVNHSRLINANMKGDYAAEAGIEKALWSVAQNATIPSQLSETINNMNVSIESLNRGTFTVYFGELVQPLGHSYDLSVSGSIAWDAGANAYKYTVTVTRQGGSTVIHLAEIGARLPLNFTYKTGSAASFADNLSTAEPEQLIDSFGARMVNWIFPSPLPSVSESDPIATQTFYITGTESTSGDYTWVVANRLDMGEIGNLTGSLYIITSTATRAGSNDVAARIVAHVLMTGNGAYVVEWKVYAQ